MKLIFIIARKDYSKASEKILKDEELAKQSVTFRESRALGLAGNEYYLDIDIDEKLLGRLEEALEGLDAKRLEGKEKENVVFKIKEQEDNAVQGFGNIFG